MADYISREAVLNMAYWHGGKADFDHPYPDGVDAVDVSDIEKIPAADVEPVRFTVAIPSETVRNYYGTWGECQSCGYDDNTVSAKYCGGCGTRLIWRVNNGD